MYSEEHKRGYKDHVGKEADEFYGKAAYAAGAVLGTAAKATYHVGKAMATGGSEGEVKKCPGCKQRTFIRHIDAMCFMCTDDQFY